MARAVLFLLLSVLTACTSTQTGSSALVANLNRENVEDFQRIRAAFRTSNPGYDLHFQRMAQSVSAGSSTLILFVQTGEATGQLAGASSTLTTGDVVVVRSEQTVHFDRPLDVLAFEVPEPPPASVPSFVRPDWDPDITDQPGGCATETGAYRRILLTWLAENGPYLFHGLNAHRVRISDSFTHYHPVEGGFDEFYLVQMVQPGARLLTTDAVDAIEAESLSAEDADDLFEVTTLRVGDLVYLPRGTIHRGLGGVLAQVIAAPGFMPGTEIGVDDHLQALNAKLGFLGERAIPHHLTSSE